MITMSVLGKRIVPPESLYESLSGNYTQSDKVQQAMRDFSPSKISDIATAVKGKTITDVSDGDEQGDTFLVFSFSDGTQLRIRYDWIYEWTVTK